MIFRTNIYSNYFERLVSMRMKSKQNTEIRHLISYWIGKQTSASLVLHFVVQQTASLYFIPSVQIIYIVQ